MASRETQILNRIRVEASKLSARLFRNNLFMGYAGKLQAFCEPTMVKAEPGDLLIRQARVIHSGFPKGSSDLIGFTPMTITEDMVGKRLAIFTACEVKTSTGKATKKQIEFINFVNDSGGIGFVANTIEKARHIFENPKKFFNK